MPDPVSSVQRYSLLDLVGRFNVGVEQARQNVETILRATSSDTTGRYEAALDEIHKHVWVAAHELILPIARAHFNAWARGELRKKDDREDYARKKELATLANQFGRFFGVALRTADADRPCILYAVGSRDKFGRYVLEDMEKKTRTGSYKSLGDLLPVELVSAPGRVEHGVPVGSDRYRYARPASDGDATNSVPTLPESGNPG